MDTPQKAIGAENAENTKCNSRTCRCGKCGIPFIFRTRTSAAVNEAKDGLAAVPVRQSKGRAPIFALVDSDDLDRVNSIRWTAVSTKRFNVAGVLCDTLVAFHETTRQGHRKKLFMPRLVMDAKQGQKVLCINGNALDCRRQNLVLKERADRQP